MGFSYRSDQAKGESFDHAILKLKLNDRSDIWAPIPQDTEILYEGWISNLHMSEN